METKTDVFDVQIEYGFPGCLPDDSETVVTGWVGKREALIEGANMVRDYIIAADYLTPEQYVDLGGKLTGCVEAAATTASCDGFQIADPCKPSAFYTIRLTPAA